MWGVKITNFLRIDLAWLARVKHLNDLHVRNPRTSLECDEVVPGNRSRGRKVAEMKFSDEFLVVE